MSKIIDVKAREILDSRGNPTVECEVFFGDPPAGGQKAWSQVPSGASTGDFEAHELRDGDKNRFSGKGVLKAVENIEKVIKPAIMGENVAEQGKIDALMLDLDGTDNKSKLGANAILAVSMAVCRAGAMASKKSLYDHISELSGSEINVPRAFYNVINGGEHAGNKIAFQEFMISPNLGNFADNYRAVAEIYQKLKKELKKKFGGEATLLGDEGGFAPNFDTAEEALLFLTEVIKETGYEGKVDFALDVAASEFFVKKKYNLGYKTDKKDIKSVKEMIDIYLNLSKKFPIISIEDPFDQQDFSAFAKLRKALKENFLEVQVVGDDLTVSNPTRIQRAIKKDSCNALLLKINQIGTITEAIEAAQLAKSEDWKVMVSHRSGETIDDFIADFSVGIGAEQIKSGAPARGERVCKYNRLLRISQDIN